MSNVFAQFLQEKGLYDEIEITQENIDDLIALVGGDVRIDSFCSVCGDKRVFCMKPIDFLLELDEKQKQLRSLADHLKGLQSTQALVNTPRPGEKNSNEWFWSNWQCANATRIMRFSFECAMDQTHHLDYVVITSGNKMKKIGQYPSVADISFPELKEYRKVADEKDLKELRRAVGLYAQGIGIGSYVYLRRIFERMIEDAKVQAVSDGNFDEELFAKSRMAEKIELLKNYLPDFLVANKTIYGIISKGIHELSEDDCIKYFPAMKEGIMRILQQREKLRKEKESEKGLSTTFAQIASEIS